MSRVPVWFGYWMLLGAGLTPGRALQILDEETSSEDGTLDVWCNDQKLQRRHIRKHLRLDEFPNEIINYVGFLPAENVGWEKPLHAYRFELDADQIKKLIAKLKRRRKREPKPRGRHDHAMRGDILDEYDRRRSKGEPHAPADLEDWAATKLKGKYGKTLAPHLDTIGRWLRERDQPPT